MERHDMTVTGRTPNERDKIYCPNPLISLLNAINL